MNLIVAVDSEWGIGRDRQLLFRIRPDLQHFRRLTVGGTVILGRTTLETFPGQRPLPDRENLVLSRQKDLTVPGAVVLPSVEAVLDRVRGLPPEKVWVIGGEQVYRQFLPFCSRAHVTHVTGRYGADAFFPDLSQHPDWHLEDPGIPQTDGDRTFRWAVYVRDSVGLFHS